MLDLISTEAISIFLIDIRNSYGHDFTNYQQNTIRRRIKLHSIKSRINNFDIYCKKVLTNRIYFEDLFKFISINITEFFREPFEFKFLKEKVLPYLSSYAHIKIWDAGCSQGMTTYSLAIILHEMNLLKKTQIYATDFNNKIVESAKKGSYSIDTLELANKNYSQYQGDFSFEKYINKTEYKFEIKDFLKEKILFFNHNLAVDKSMNEFQLIICKNVLIYFDSDLKQRVVKLFDDSLCINGFLSIGKNEYIDKYLLENYKQYSQNKKVFKKCK